MQERIERALARHVASTADGVTPPRLAAAMRHAVFPGGARIRPRLCLAVARACGDDAPALSEAAAVAVELLHCASLVHDDMPCFDNAPERRGLPSVHRAWGQPLALLAGDGLIVMAFEALARGAAGHPARLPGLLAQVAAGVGPRDGIVAGQAWECETAVDLGRYQRAKTGALFVASACAGALAAGAAPEPWRRLGECLGEAYQVADDLHDVMGDARKLGKPVGQDDHYGRPSAAAELGLVGALERFRRLMDEATESVPAGPAQQAMRQLLQRESERLVPQADAQRLLAGDGLATGVAP